VSGTIGEELAVETFKSGATDYVLKSKLSRLVPAVKRAVKEAAERADRKRTEAELHESQERYRKLVETMNEGLGVQDENGKITYLNNRFCELLGYTPDEIIGRNVSDFLDEENREIFRTQMAKRRTGEKGPYEIAWGTKAGGKIYTYLSPEPIFDSSGKFVGSFAVLTDISEIRRTREELKKRVKELEDFYDMAVGRELRMIELKDEIKQLKKELERNREVC
jgi:PAS domain S-box-containing protein